MSKPPSSSSFIKPATLNNSAGSFPFMSGPGPGCIFCRSVLRTSRGRKTPGAATVRSYNNYNVDHDRITRPQTRFPKLEKRNEDGEVVQDVNAAGLPLSPIMDKEKWDARYKRTPKAATGMLHEMTEQQRELLKNPYARALADTIRMDFYYSLRIPRFFLLPFSPRLNPETELPWALPYGIKTSDNKISIPKPRRYMLCSLDLVRYLSAARRRWNRVIHDQVGMPSNVVWREDMGEFVLRQLRERAYAEVLAVKRYLHAADGEGGGLKTKFKDVGCIMVWERTADTSGSNARGEQHQLSSSDESAGSDELAVLEGDEQALITESSSSSDNSEREPTDVPKAPLPRTSAKVGDKVVAVYHMNAILGDDLASKLKSELRLDENVANYSLMFANQTISAHLWMLKLSGYIRRE